MRRTPLRRTTPLRRRARLAARTRRPSSYRDQALRAVLELAAKEGI